MYKWTSAVQTYVVQRTPVFYSILKVARKFFSVLKILQD